MWFIVAMIVSLGSGFPMGEGISTKNFDTKEACLSAVDAVVAHTKAELEPQGATISGVACVPRDKVPPDLLEACDRGRI